MTKTQLSSGLTKIKSGIDRSTSSLETVFKSFADLKNGLDNLIDDVSSKQLELNQLEEKYKILYRNKKIELDLSFREEEEKIIKNWAKNNKKEIVNADEYQKTLSDFSSLSESVEGMLAKKEEEVTTNLHNYFKSKMDLISSEHNANVAQITAELNSLKVVNESLTSQVDRLYKQLEAERAAGIERAKASSIGSVNLSPSSK